MKTIIVGAGASGLLCSTLINSDTLLIEQNDCLGKKILATGNGRCNYWNSEIDISKYNTDSNDNLNLILKNKDKVLKYLFDLGIYPTIKNGYYYPYSKEASSVRDLLVEKINKNVKVKLNTKVKKIEKVNDKFIVHTNKEVYECNNLVIGMGSCASPKTGSDGSGYEILKDKLKLNKVFPSLVQLKCIGNYFKEWDGVRVDSKVSLIVNNRTIKEEKGELQLTDYGLSGICIFNLSGLVNKYLYNKDKVFIKINFFEDIESLLEVKEDNIYNVLRTIFNHKLLDLFLKLTKINKNDYYKNLSKEKKKLLIDTITNMKLEVKETNSFDKCQVCTGGFSLKDINPKNMESKIKNLYLMGEILDVDGNCGGYNLAFAFISGYLVGSDINDKC